MATRRRPSFASMCRTFPMRTALFTAGPLLFGVAQLLNAYVHGTGLLGPAAVTGLLLVFSLLVTQYHLASFRVTRLEGTTGSR